MAAERQTVDGHNCTVCYLASDGSETDRVHAVNVRIYYDDAPTRPEECSMAMLLPRMGDTFEARNEDFVPTLPLFGNHQWRPPI